MSAKNSSEWSVSPKTALAVALVALIVALAAVALPMIAPSSASSDQMTALQGQVSQLQQQINSLPATDQTPTTRHILLEWMNNENTGQDRFYPNFITVNQGDNVSIIFEDNDTDGHTFEVLLPQGLYILNNSLIGQTNHLTLLNFTTPPDNCQIASTVVPCNTVGNCNSAFSACNVTSSVSFVVTQPGVYRYFCIYHQSLGMYGFLVVLPNRAYIPTNSTSTGS